jgi:hypothetical protein
MLSHNLNIEATNEVDCLLIYRRMVIDYSQESQLELN